MMRLQSTAERGGCATAGRSSPTATGASTATNPGVFSASPRLGMLVATPWSDVAASAIVGLRTLACARETRELAAVATGRGRRSAE